MQTLGGVREIRDLMSRQWQGICSSHPHLSFLIPQIAKGCKEENMDEGIAEKVNQRTMIGMSSTADA